MEFEQPAQPSQRYFELASPILQHMSLQSIHLAAVDAERNNHFSAADVADTTLRLQRFVTHIPPKSSDDPRSVCMRLRNTLTAVRNDAKKEAQRRTMHVSVAFDLYYVYSGPAELTTDGILPAYNVLMAFGEVQAVFHVWPYLREYIQDTVCRMGLPAVTLPSLSPMTRPISNKGND